MPDLRLDVIADADAAAAELTSVGAAARGMASDVSSASSTVASSARDMDGLADSADNLDSKASQATGAFGALAGGLEAAGFEGAAAGLQGVAIATDFASGAGGLMNLVLQSQAVLWIRSTAAQVGHTAASTAQAAASGVATAAQWAWNAAMSANPIGVVIVGLTLLAGGLVLAYNKVAPFREAVDSAMGLARDAVGFVVGKVEDLVGWVKDAADHWDAIRSAAGKALDPVEDAVGNVSDALSTAVGWVQDLVGWIGRIDFPDAPDWLKDAAGGIGGIFTRAASTEARGGGGSLTLNINTTPMDMDAWLSELVEQLTSFYAARGITLSITQEAAF